MRILIRRENPHPGAQQFWVDGSGRSPYPPYVAGPLVPGHHPRKTISLNVVSAPGAVLTDLTQQAGAPRLDDDSNPHRSDCPPAH